MKVPLLAALFFSALASSQAADPGKQLKVFILAGQSNMEGHAKVETFDYIGDDPATAPLLKEKDRNPESGSGHYYRLMIGHIENVLSDVARVCPEYDPKAGYEIAGFVWFQGFNDMVNRDVYPPVDKDSPENRFADYSKWMADFIRDVRKDLDTPKLPFVIGVMGVGGKTANPDNLKFREAMAAPASLPEFKGNVVAIQTGEFWDEPLGAIQEKYEKVRQMAYLLRTKNKNQANADGSMSEADQKEYLKKFEAELISPEDAAMRARGASNAGYHYLGCAKTFAEMGQSFANAILEMRKLAK